MFKKKEKEFVPKNLSRPLTKKQKKREVLSIIALMGLNLALVLLIIDVCEFGALDKLLNRKELKFKGKQQQLRDDYWNYMDTIPEQAILEGGHDLRLVASDTSWQRIFNEYFAAHPKEKVKFDKANELAKRLTIEQDSLTDAWHEMLYDFESPPADSAGQAKIIAEFRAAFKNNYEKAKKAGLECAYDIWRGVGKEEFYLPILPPHLQKEYDRISQEIHDRYERDMEIRAEKSKKLLAEQEKYLRRYADTIGYKKYK
ncbi:MAG: hypothetical protein FWE50_02750 [Alphaproteobacteria bacterium]|nr:hypothetical protein [Alphaproteobacteria bacterium]